MAENKVVTNKEYKRAIDNSRLTKSYKENILSARKLDNRGNLGHAFDDVWKLKSKEKKVITSFRPENLTSLLDRLEN